MKHKIIFFGLVGVMIIGLIALKLLLSDKTQFDGYFKECNQDFLLLKNEILAWKTKDSSLCGQDIACKALATGDDSFCNGLEGSESCKAIISKNPSLCEQDDSWCSALASGDVSLCNAFKENDTIKQCTAFVSLDSSYYEKELSECNDFAWSNVAFGKKDKSYCKKIEDTTVYDSCLARLS